MPRSRLFWGIFRVCYFVDAIIGVAILLVYLFPPKDGDVAHALIGTTLLNLCWVVIGWAFIPWHRFDPSAPTPAPAAAPLPDPKQDLEEIHGQESLEDFLEKRRTQRR